VNQVPPEALAKLAVAPLFQEMTEDQIHRYCGGGTWRRLSEGNNLFFKDDPAGMMFVIVEGYFSVEAETSAGETVLLKLRGPGEILGELSVVVETGRTADVVALTPARVYAWPAAAMQDGLEDDPLLSQGMIRLLGDKLVESMNDRVASFYPVESRLAHALLDLARRMGVRQEDRSVEIPLVLSQRTLSRLVHCSREYTNKALSRMRKDGVITYTDAGHLRLLQLKSLRAMAEPSVT